MSKVSFWTTTTLVLALAQLGLCNVIAPEDNPLLTRENIAKLSAIRVQARSVSVESRCSLYATTLEELVGDKIEKQGGDLFSEVIEVLKHRKLPFGNPQPVLEDLQECAKQGANVAEQPSPKREVIAGPPRDQIPTPDERMQRIKEEHDEVKQRTKDQGQDIYYKPDSPAAAVGDFKWHDDPNNGGGLLKKIANELENEPRNAESDESDSDSIEDGDEDDDDVSVEEAEKIDNSRADREKLEMELEQKRLEVENLEKQVEGLSSRIVEITAANDKAGAEHDDEYRAKYESMKRLYEDSSERERHLRQVIAEADDKIGKNDKQKDKKKDKKGDKKDDKKKIKDPAEQAAILFDKLSAKDQPEDRCYKYYLLFSYPDKVKKKTIKTIAKLQINLRDMDEFYALINPAFVHKLEKILNVLAASKETDARRAADEFKQCLTAPTADDTNLDPGEIKVEYAQPENNNGQYAENPNRFDIPVELYPRRKTVDTQFLEDTYEQIYPPAPGLIGPQGSVAEAWAAAAAGGYGNSNGRGFGNMRPIDPMGQDHHDYYYGKNPYMR